VAEARWRHDESWISPYDLRSSCYCFVKLSGDQIVMCDTSGEQPVGILQNHPQSGEIASVRVMGRSKVKGAATVLPGRYVKTNHSGMAISVKSGDWYMALAQERTHAGTETHVMAVLPRQALL
jgi:hypothetical protein